MSERMRLVPNAILPEQYMYQSFAATGDQPEKRLMFAVLLTGIAALRHKGEVQAIEAKRWVQSSDSRWPFSFENVCYALGYEPDSLRNGLLRDTTRLELQAHKRKNAQFRITNRRKNPKS